LTSSSHSVRPRKASIVPPLIEQSLDGAWIDPSAGFVVHARKEIIDKRAVFKVGDAQDIALPDNGVDLAVSALVLNFGANMEIHFSTRAWAVTATNE
jgi:Methyltransferase domain